MMPLSDTPVGRLKNIGPKSAEWLHDIGVYTYADLQQMGALLAYTLIKSQHPQTTAVMLYALVGALKNVHWNSFSQEEKEHLKQEAHAIHFPDTQPK